jgi:serine/threonine-protein kinase
MQRSDDAADAARNPETVDELAALYLEQHEAGEAPALETFLDRLAGEDERSELRELVAAALAAEAHLPRADGGDSVVDARYRILEPIGQGGMGRVYAAWDEQLRRRVAIKTLSGLDLYDAERRELFLRESRMLASMQHPGIVAVHEARCDEDGAYIVMDLVDGTSLADVLERARRELEVVSSDTKLLPKEGELLERAIGRDPAPGRESLIDERSWFRTVNRIAFELARTLEFAHASRIVHRDLKPGNVMLLGGAHPVVLDFGLSGSVESADGAVTQGLFGSAAYLAPEQVVNHQIGNDPRTDVYQLGLVLYEMLTLRRAFPGSVLGEVFARIKEGDYKPPRQWNGAIPRALAAVCKKALEPAPEHRYQSAAELAADLDRCLADEDPLALHAHPVRTLRRSVRRAFRRHPVAATAAAALAVVGLFFWQGRDLLAGEWQGESFPVRWDADGKRTSLQADDRLRIGDRLGARVITSEPIVTYVLSVFREDRSEERLVRPMRAQCVSQHNCGAGRGPDGQGWGLGLGAGKHDLVCSLVDWVDEESRLANAYEGLLVLSFPDACDELELALGEVERQAHENLGGVPYDDAHTVVRLAYGSTRGRPVAMNDDERKRVFESMLESAGREAASAWEPLPGIRDPWQLEWPVEVAR